MLVGRTCNCIEPVLRYNQHGFRKGQFTLSLIGVNSSQLLRIMLGLFWLSWLNHEQNITRAVRENATCIAGSSEGTIDAFMTIDPSKECYKMAPLNPSYLWLLMITSRNDQLTNSF